MQIDPARVAYLAAASGRLGPIAERHIRQRGEAIAPLSQRFALLDHPSLAGLRPPTPALPRKGGGRNVPSPLAGEG